MSKIVTEKPKSLNVDSYEIINIEYHEKNKEALRKEYLNNSPFPYIAIDDFLVKGLAEELYASIPTPKETNKSRDYIFAKNKFEISNMVNISDNFKKLYDELISERFANLISYVTNEDLFVDPKFHGGGLHLGGKDSFLDMHVDFNYHPSEPKWYRNVNLLLYLNQDWKPEYGGQLKLVDKHTKKGTSVDVPMNRLTIMPCRNYTLHGYDPINFPEGTYRTSIATYAYTIHDKPIEKPRSTYWQTDNSLVKNLIGKAFLPLVTLKSKLFGSGTSKNHN